MVEKTFDGVFEQAKSIQDEFDVLGKGLYLMPKVYGEERIDFLFVNERGEEVKCSETDGGKLFELQIQGLKIKRVKHLDPSIVKFDLDNQGRIVFV